MDMPIEDARQYTGITEKAVDFDLFWKQALIELDAVEPQVEIVPAPMEFGSAGCFWLRFRGTGSARIQAKLLMPKKAGRHPALLMFHGYTGDSGDWLGLLPYAAEGFCVAALDCRGQAGGSEDIGSYGGYTVKGHFIRGLTGDPQNMLYRHIYLDTVLLARIVAALPEVDEKRMAGMGNSQGGALSIACNALSGLICRTVVIHPFLSDFRRCMQLDICRQNWSPYSELFDFFRRIDPLHQREAEYMKKLSYIDTHNLASRVSGQVLMFITQCDNACPPSTQYAVYNSLSCRKHLVEYQDFDHEWPPQMQDRCFTFLKPLLEEVDP